MSHFNVSLIVWAKSLELVSWYFEPSQQQSIASGLKQTSLCLPFTLLTYNQTTNSLKTTKSVLTQFTLYNKTHKRQTQNFRRISPFGIAPV